MKVPPIPALILALISLGLPACQMHKEEEVHEEQHKLILTSPEVKDVVVTQPYVCQIRSQRNIEVCALAEGYLEKIPVKEGQAVKTGEVMFQILPVLYQAKLDAELAEVKVAELEYKYTMRLFESKPPVVSQVQVQLDAAKLAKAQAKANQTRAELNFTTVRAPFDGIINRLQKQQGSKIDKGDVLTTLSDNSVMWVYFNVPEARYFEFMALRDKNKSKPPTQHQDKSQQSTQLELVDSRIELVLADGSTFDQPASNTVTVEGQFNNETGNIPFRADFPNPDRLLRHGQTGTVLIHHIVHDAIVIPQRATFEVLDKRYVYVVDEDKVVHQRPITILHEKDDIFLIKQGVEVKEKIILEGIRQVHEGSKVEDYEFRQPEEALKNQKNHAE